MQLHNCCTNPDVDRVTPLSDVFLNFFRQSLVKFGFVMTPLLQLGQLFRLHMPGPWRSAEVHYAAWAGWNWHTINAEMDMIRALNPHYELRLYRIV